MHATRFLAVAFSCASFAQYPPAQGPVAPLPTDQPRMFPSPYGYDDHQIRLIVDGKVREKVAAILAETNKRVNPKLPDEIAAACKLESPACDEARALVSFEGLTASQPYMTQTKFTDQPNSRYLKMPYIVNLKISEIRFSAAGKWIYYPWTRAAFVSLEVGIFCDRWETGVGKIVAQTHAERPSLDSDPSFSEQVVNAFLANSLIPAVDSAVRSGFQTIVVAPDEQNLSCVRMDYLPGDPADLHKGALRVVNAKPIPPLFIQNITVKLVQIKRLPVQAPDGRVVYDVVERPTLEFYANFAHAYHELGPISEGQTVSLSALPAIFTPKPGTAGSLILIANIAHNLGNPEDSAFVVLPGSGNFGHGRQTLTVTKTYSFTPPPLPPNPLSPLPPPRPKPTKVTVPAYEITVDISVPGSVGTGAF